MFITRKRHEREKLELAAAGTRLTDAILQSVSVGVFMLDARDKILPQVSSSLKGLFRRTDFGNLAFEKLLTPIVTAKTLGEARKHLALLRESAAGDEVDPGPFGDVEVRLTNADGSFDAAHYAFEFSRLAASAEPAIWLVQVTDITARVQQTRELEDLGTNHKTQAEILRGIVQLGVSRFGASVQRTAVAMQSIDAILKKPAREDAAFRAKLEETLDQVDRVRREGAALKLTALETAARNFEDSLHELGGRTSLSGNDFLPLAVKLDELFSQFALVRSLTGNRVAAKENDSGPAGPHITETGTQIIEAPKFVADLAERAAVRGATRTPPAGSLESTLLALTEHVAEEQAKTVVLQCTGLHKVPGKYQATVKNLAIQLIRNAVVHGIETPADRERAGKLARGTLQLEFKQMENGGFDMYFQDDGRGLDPDQVRQVAVAKGLLTDIEADELRDRQAIKLIFKIGYTTQIDAAGQSPRGTGLSFVRRYVHEAGGRISLASLPGHETRFKVTLPAVTAEETQVA
jgi:chemotaxis protein histidine kinase CheA